MAETGNEARRKHLFFRGCRCCIYLTPVTSGGFLVCSSLNVVRRRSGISHSPISESYQTQLVYSQSAVAVSAFMRREEFHASLCSHVFLLSGFPAGVFSEPPFRPSFLLFVLSAHADMFAFCVFDEKKEERRKIPNNVLWGSDNRGTVPMDITLQGEGVTLTRARGELYIIQRDRGTGRLRVLMHVFPNQ
ncbi:uncharacterized [Tachysurus ichikawai]